jgi:hypothetical protein
MSWPETAALIVGARREGVTLTAKADGKLGFKADRPLPDELLSALRDHKADILALLPPPPCASVAVERAKQMIARLRALAFWPYLNADGLVLIADETRRRRSVADYLPVGEVFDDLVAGLADDRGLLDPYTDPGKGGGKRK